MREQRQSRDVGLISRHDHWFCLCMHRRVKRIPSQSGCLERRQVLH